MSAQTLWAYALVAWLAAATPGPAVLLALRNGATHGFRAGLCSSLGNQVGLVTLAGASILGLGVILHTSAWLFGLVKLVGAGYLIWLGWRLLRTREGLNLGAACGPTATAFDGWRMLRLGVWVSLTNPKAILFFGALFPQFVRTDQALAPQFLTLMTISVAASMSCLLSYVWMAHRARRWLTRPAAMVWVNRVTGGVFVLLGLTLAGLRRPV